MMNNKASASDEARLAQAVERGATRASVNTDADRNVLLVEELKQAGIPLRFAKTASQAFNKRLTVHLLKNTPDEEKAKPFALSDPDTVLELMGGQTKTASVQLDEEFFITSEEVAAPVMKKSASAAAPVLPHQELSVGGFKKELGRLLDKHAAKFQELNYKLDSMEASIEKQASALAHDIQTHRNSAIVLDNLCNLYGDALGDALVDYMPEGTSFSKTASQAVPYDDRLCKMAEKLINDCDDYFDLHETIADYKEQLQEFAKTAKEVALDISDKEFNGLLKESAFNTGAITRGGVSFLGGGLSAADSFRTAMQGAAEDAFGNARSMYNAAGGASLRPDAVVDAEFVAKDRYRDRLMAWSDMSADPQFAAYPSEQVFKATQKAMDLVPDMERPDRRELLRTYVAQLLLQNNRVNTADMGALAQTVRGLGSSAGTAAAEAAAEARALDKEVAPDAPEFVNLAARIAPGKFQGLSQGMDQLGNREYERAVRHEKDDSDKQKERAAQADKQISDRAKALTDRAEKATREQKAKADEAAKEQKRLDDLKAKQLANLRASAVKRLGAYADPSNPDMIMLNRTVPLTNPTTGAITQERAIPRDAADKLFADLANAQYQALYGGKP